MNQKIRKNLLIILLIVACILLIIDIYKGSFYGNLSHLSFDHQKFNNLVTPIAAIISIIFYSAALRTTRHQNKIILSQNLKPYYEKKISDLVSKGEKIHVFDITGQHNPPANRHAFTYTGLLRGAVWKIVGSREYKYDCERIGNGAELKLEDLYESEYYQELIFLNQFDNDFFSVNFFYKDVKLFVAEVNASPLLKEDKTLLKMRIKNELLGNYMETIKYFDRDSMSLTPIIPTFRSGENLKLKKITDFGFTKHYDEFVKELGDPWS